LADVGLIGLPNAGKSTLISAISSASPKIGNYPFTTITPNLGVVHVEWGEPFVVADIPGLIEGAHQGAGLGIQFLRHIERTRLLVHLIDAQAIDPQAPLKAYKTINNELRRYGHNLAAKPQIVVLNKMDLPGTDTLAQVFQTEMVRVHAPTSLQISAATRQGIDALISKIVERLDHVEDAQHPRQ
jgi:GTP-binding protein